MNIKNNLCKQGSFIKNNFCYIEMKDLESPLLNIFNENLKAQSKIKTDIEISNNIFKEKKLEE